MIYVLIYLRCILNKNKTIIKKIILCFMNTNKLVAVYEFYFSLTPSLVQEPAIELGTSTTSPILFPSHNAIA